MPPYPTLPYIPTNTDTTLHPKIDPGESCHLLQSSIKVKMMLSKVTSHHYIHSLIEVHTYLSITGWVWIAGTESPLLPQYLHHLQWSPESNTSDSQVGSIEINKNKNKRKSFTKALLTHNYYSCKANTFFVTDSTSVFIVIPLRSWEKQEQQ